MLMGGVFVDRVKACPGNDVLSPKYVSFLTTVATVGKSRNFRGRTGIDWECMLVFARRGLSLASINIDKRHNCGVFSLSCVSSRLFS